MDEGSYQPLSPTFQQCAREGSRSDDWAGSCSDANRCNHVFITYICATYLVSGLYRVSTGFYYVSTEINAKIMKTPKKPISVGKGMVEWDTEILMPSEQSSSISFKVYASMGRGTRQGNGVLLCRFKTTVGDLLDSSEELQPIRFLDKKGFSSYPSLRIVTERRSCNVDVSATISGLSELDPTSRLTQLTNIGLHALLRYRQLHTQKDLDDAITHFERARDMCSPDHPNRSAVLFNLATAKFVHCQENKHYHDLDVPVTLYQEAFRLRSGHHTDRCVTALDLCFGLLAYLRRQGDKADGTRIEDLLPGVVESYAYRAAWLSLQMAGISVLIRSKESGITETDSAGRGDEESMGRACAMLPGFSGWDRPAELAVRGMLLLCRFKSDGNLADVNNAILIFGKAVQLAPDGHLFKPISLDNLGTSLGYRFQHLGNLTDISKSISAFEQALSLTSSDDPYKPALLENLGLSLIRRFERLSNVSDINKSISISETLLRLTPNGHSDKATRLATLGTSLYRRFERLGRLTDINTSISVQEEAVHLTPNNHPSKCTYLTNFGNSLLRRFERLADLADLEKSISMQEGALRLTPDGDIDKPIFLTNLGLSLISRSKHLGDLADINRAILTLEEALRLTPGGHHHRPIQLNNLGNALSGRYQHLGDLADMNESILVLEEAVRLTPTGHPDKLARMINLGKSLSGRFQRLGDPADINKSISIEEEAVHLTPHDHPDRVSWLSDLGSSLSTRFERLGDFADINKSIFLIEEAVRLTLDDHPSKPALLSGLGSCLSHRFEALGHIADINRSVSVLEQAIHLISNGHPGKPAHSNVLATSLFHRFQHLGSLADINKSILLLEDTLNLAPNGHPSRPTWLSNLGNSLRGRFELLGDLADVTKSILLTEEALHLTPGDHPDKPAWLSHHGTSLLFRFERLGELADIDKSISVQEEAIRLTPSGDPDKPIWLNNLGTSLASRYKHSENLVDLNMCISVQEEALRLTPDGHPGKPARLNNLGSSLSRRFQCLGHLTDLSESIQMFEEALRLTPNGHLDKPAWLIHLGSSLFYHFRHSRDPSSLSAAILHFSLASRAPTGPAYIRFSAARNWITSALFEGKSQVLLDAYTAAINLLPELAWVGLPLAERHRVLPEAADVARDAAAVAIEAGCPEMAVGWLEQGRSVVWSQFLQLRSPVDELHVEHPALATRFQEISRELEHASSRENASSRMPLEKEVQRHHDLALTRERLLVEIRSLPGFERFLLPNTVKQLIAPIHSGSVIYLNASKGRCDALIVMAGSGDVISVPFPDISYLQMGRLQGLLHLMLKHNHLIISHDDVSGLIPPDVNPASKELLDLLLIGDGVEAINRAARVRPQRIAGYTSDDLLKQILAFLWRMIVKPVLDALGFSTPLSRSQKMTRIFWCPTGPFAFLPIHAAGLYGTAEVGVKLSDFAVSSYIPTLGALAPSPQKESNGSSSKIHLVAVPQPLTDGLNGLVSVKEEIAHIRTLSARSPFVTLQDSDGTVEDVMDKMRSADWVHFACHGVQDPDNPLDSGLCLADGRRLKLSDIIRLSRPQGGLAFLSACQTAQGDEKLTEESVHLAAGMLLAGYGGVIATMWAISDPDAPKVAKDVYGHLFREGKKVPDCTEAAEALHYAVQRLRDSGASFCSWVPFIHVGR